jgi:hypothetical protein
MRLSLVAAKALCRELGMTPRGVQRLKLRPGMERDAVLTLASQHLRMIERTQRKATAVAGTAVGSE